MSAFYVSYRIMCTHSIIYVLSSVVSLEGGGQEVWKSRFREVSTMYEFGKINWMSLRDKISMSLKGAV